MRVFSIPIVVQADFIGQLAYADAVRLMESTIAHAEHDKAQLWGLEHPLVYTSGLKTSSAHILDAEITPIPARRGGSVTLHNPGQLVIYFSVPFRSVNGGLERFVRVLEAILAEILLEYAIAANLSPGASGVFTSQGKIAFIGLGLKSNYIYHGISFNVSNNLADFQRIQPCGLTLPMTRMADFLKSAPTLEEVFSRFVTKFTERASSYSPTQFREQREKIYDFTDWRLGFKLGWLAFHERRYWEAHEIWEMYWQEMPPGELRIFFHAMIQMAMAWYKIFTAHNRNGALSLLSKAFIKFQVTPEIQLLQNQEELLQFLERATWLLEECSKANAADFKNLSALTPPVFAWL